MPTYLLFARDPPIAVRRRVVAGCDTMGPEVEGKGGEKQVFVTSHYLWHVGRRTDSCEPCEYDTPTLRC